MNDRENTQVDKLSKQLGALQEVKLNLPRRFWERMMMAPRRIFPMGLLSIQINPFELFFLFALTMLGVSYGVFQVDPPGSVATLLPTPAVSVWASTLAVGSLCALVGGLWTRAKHLDTALAAYQFGWGLIGISCMVYGASVAVVYPTTGLYTATINLTLSVACWCRVVQVSRFFRLSQTFIREQTAVKGERDVDAPGT